MLHFGYIILLLHCIKALNSHPFLELSKVMSVVSQVHLHDIKESSNPLIILKYCYTPNHLHLVVEKVAVACWKRLCFLDNCLSGF